MKAILLYLLIINASAFLLMLMDKRKSKKNLWRIPEKALLGVALIGGSIGAYAGMQIFRHKTKHLKFTVGIPVIIALQLIATACFLSK